MVLAVVRADGAREGRTPPRDLVLAFLADEEAGGDYGAHCLVDNHPDLFDGLHRGDRRGRRLLLTVGDDLRLYLIETAEKGIDWLRLHATGRPGHGSMIHDDNAVTALAEAVARVGRHRFPVVVTADRAGVPRARSPTRSASSWTRTTRRRRSPSSARSRRSSARPCATPPTRPGWRPATRTTSSPAGPAATIDCRTLPGQSRGVPGRSCARWSARTSRSSTSSASRRWRPPSTAPWSRRWRRRCGPRTRARGRCRTCSPAAPTPRRSPSSASAASASRRCGCRPT